MLAASNKFSLFPAFCFFSHTTTEQCFFKLTIIFRSGTTWTSLLKTLCLTIPCGLFSGGALTIAIYQSKQRGDDYYKKLMDGPWFNDNARRYFMYACDIVSCFLWKFLSSFRCLNMRRVTDLEIC
jgi:hypothetical protein